MGPKNSKLQGQDYKELMQNYTVKRRIYDERYQEATLLEEKNTQQEFLLKEITSNSEQEFKDRYESFSEKMKYKHPNILQFVGFASKSEAQLCSTFFKTYLLFEYASDCLENQVKIRKNYPDRKLYYTEEEMWIIIESLVTAMAYFEEIGIMHGDIRPSNVFVTKEGVYKVADITLLSQNSAYSQILMSNSRDHTGIYLAPILVEALKNSFMMPKCDSYKSDVYSLGMCMLQALTLEPSDDVYDYQTFTIANQRIEQKFLEARIRYSSILIDFLKSFLIYEEENRPNFNQLKNSLQNDPKIKYQKDNKGFQLTSHSEVRQDNLINSGQFNQFSNEKISLRVNSPQVVENRDLFQSQQMQVNIQNSPFNMSTSGYRQEKQENEKKATHVLQQSQNYMGQQQQLLQSTPQQVQLIQHDDDAYKPQKQVSSISKGETTIQYDDINALLKKYGIEPINTNTIQNVNAYTKPFQSTSQISYSTTANKQSTTNFNQSPYGNTSISSQQQPLQYQNYAQNLTTSNNYNNNQQPLNSSIQQQQQQQKYQQPPYQSAYVNLYNQQIQQPNLQTQQTFGSKDYSEITKKVDQVLSSIKNDQQQNLYGNQPQQQQENSNFQLKDYTTYSQKLDDSKKLQNQQNLGLQQQQQYYQQSPPENQNQKLVNNTENEQVKQFSYYQQGQFSQPEQFKSSIPTNPQQVTVKTPPQISGIQQNSNLSFGGVKLNSQEQLQQQQQQQQKYQQQQQQQQNLMGGISSSAADRYANYTIDQRVDQILREKYGNDYDKQFQDVNNSNNMQKSQGGVDVNKDIAELDFNKKLVIDQKKQITPVVETNVIVQQPYQQQQSQLPVAQTVGLKYPNFESYQKSQQKQQQQQQQFQPQQQEQIQQVGQAQNYLDQQNNYSHQLQQQQQQQQNFQQVSDGQQEVDYQQNLSHQQDQYEQNQNLYISQGQMPGKKEFMIENYQNGSVYQGEKMNGLRHGKGKFFYSDGGIYDGDWFENKMQGYGTLYYQGGKPAYEGEWIDDKFEGQGVLYNETPAQLEGTFDFTDMDKIEEYWTKYEGGFSDDNKEGQGALYLSNEEKFVGNFSQDAINGKGKFFKMDGTVVEGYWVNNKFAQ